MIQFFKDVKIDWLANRRIFIAISLVLMLAGLGSAVVRQLRPGGTEAFNLGVDFKGGTVITVQFRQRPSAEAVRAALEKVHVRDSIILPISDKPDQHLIKLPQMGSGDGQDQAQVDIGRDKVKEALTTFGSEAPHDKDLNTDPTAAFKIIGTDAVGPVAGRQLRNQAITVTLLALVGILIYIAFRFEWTYGAAAVIAVFHDVLVTVGIFSIFQWEISLTVIAALLTLVGFSVNDTIVVFDRIRENSHLNRRESLYKITNDSLNQTLSRTVITSGLVFLSVLAMVIFGGEVLWGFSIALLIGIVFGTYSSIAIASPIMVWWQMRVEAAAKKGKTPVVAPGGGARSRGGVAHPSERKTGGSSVPETQRAARS